jgi:hypothetical protein
LQVLDFSREKEPEPHSKQILEPNVSSERVPPGQEEHDAAPATLEKRPGPQIEHSVAPRLSEKLPGGQRQQTLEPALEE